MATTRILVVDDEEDLCEILKFNLEIEGYEVDTAYSAEEALKKDLTVYNLLLLDVMMGEISGFKMARILPDGSSGGVVILRSVILVADGEHEVREERQLEESEVPVALVLLSMQILCLTTECQLVVDAILALCDVDVRMD